MFIADSAESFRSVFSASLAGMLRTDEVGAFILVLANSMQDGESHAGLTSGINAMYDQLSVRIDAHGLEVTPDDRDVFRALMDRGIDGIDIWKTVLQGDWEININPMRALRPPRASAEIVAGIRRDFDANKFNFNRPFLQPEILWEGRWGGHDFRVLYNKFPFAPYHLILVPDPQREHPQYLLRRHHALALRLSVEYAAVVPGFALAYNSIGAGASVNQLHFQSLVREQPLPVERKRWQHNGGDESYPVECVRLSSEEQSWLHIQRLHDANTAYNLLYREGACYVLCRRLQGDESISEGIRGAGWIELCGVFNVPDETALRGLDATRLEARLASLRL